jgi:Domain of unknown function (DUF6473)
LGLLGGVMMQVQAGAGALDYFPCRYGLSKAMFRGPARDLSGDYVVALGGTATFGKYVEEPFPRLLEQAMGKSVVNLGGLNAGPDFYLSDQATLRVISRARLAVVEVTGADTLSNPYYSVHIRRNDRFVAPRQALRDLYPEVDFTDIHFTRHLLSVLRRTDPVRFRVLEEGLRSNWLARMRALMAHLPLRRVLLWLGEDIEPSFGPMMVTAGMLEALRPAYTTLVRVVPSEVASAEGQDQMRFPETEAALARCLPGLAVHREVAAKLGPAVAALV